MILAKNRTLLVSCLLAAFLACGVQGACATDDAFTLDARRETAIIATEAGLGILGVVLIRHVDAPDPASLRRNDVPGFDRSALGHWSDSADRASDLTKSASAMCAIFAVSYPLLRPGNDSYRPVIENLVLYTETVMLVSGMTAVAKGAFHRSRPYAYDTSVPIETRKERDAALSFWSGHTSGAFASAVFAGTVFQARSPRSKLIVPVWITSLTAATATGVLRVSAGRHFPSDVAAGAMMGAFAGWIVPRMHRERDGATRITAGVDGTPGICFKRRF